MSEAAGVILVTKDTGEIAVGKRAREVSNPGQVSIPGGHLEDGETPKQAAIREFREETGIKISSEKNNIEKVDKSCAKDTCFHTFIGTTQSGQPFQPYPRHAHEHSKLVWADPSKVLQISSIMPEFEYVLKSNIDKVKKRANQNKNIDELQESVDQFVNGMNGGNIDEYVKSDGKVDLYHYTDAFGDSEKVLLHPVAAKNNSRSHSKKEWQASGVPRLFFYLDKSHQEKFYEGKPCYKTSVPVQSIYDITEDPLSLKEAGRSYDMDHLLKNVSGWYVFREGWDREEGVARGMYYEHRFPVVIYFTPLKAKRIE